MQIQKYHDFFGIKSKNITTFSEYERGTINNFVVGYGLLAFAR